MPPLDKTYTTNVDLTLIDSVLTITGVTATTTQVAATSFLSGPSGVTNVTGLITAGTNVTLTGGGTSGSPYVVNSSGGAGTVSSVFTRTGAITATSGDYSVAQITGAAPLASPALTGSPTAPTQTSTDNSTKLATTAYVTTAILNAAATYDDVLDYANLAAFPATGATGILYVANDTNFIYRWGGSSYTAVGGVTAGTVTSVAVSGGTTGLTATGGPITGSGTITFGGTLGVANGGTGNTTGTATVNANSTGDVTSVGNATTLANTSNVKTIVANDSIPLIIALG